MKYNVDIYYYKILILTSRPDTIIPSIFMSNLDHSTAFYLSGYTSKCTVNTRRRVSFQTFTTMRMVFITIYTTM